MLKKNSWRSNLMLTATCPILYNWTSSMIPQRRLIQWTSAAYPGNWRECWSLWRPRGPMMHSLLYRNGKRSWKYNPHINWRSVSVLQTKHSLELSRDSTSILQRWTNSFTLPQQVLQDRLQKKRKVNQERPWHEKASKADRGLQRRTLYLPTLLLSWKREYPQR